MKAVAGHVYRVSRSWHTRIDQALRTERVVAVEGWHIQVNLNRAVAAVEADSIALDQHSSH